VASSSAKVRLTDHSGKGNLVASHPLIAPDGQVHVREDKRFTPLVIDGRPVALSPDTRDSLVGARWCQGDRVVFRHRSGVEVLDAATGESMAFLDGGHGLPNWGFVELANGTLVTWSRGVLRSWDAVDYAPLVELDEPVDWGPGYEYVMPTRDHGVLFTVGKHSMDTRVVHWDGRDDLLVYTGHRNEVGSFVEGPGGRILSYEDDRRGDILVWQLRQADVNLSQEES
jgi:hypothetical protein